MTPTERDLMQHLVSAAVRVARTPMTGVALDSRWLAPCSP